VVVVVVVVVVVDISFEENQSKLFSLIRSSSASAQQ